jgi:hypothetical protein
MDLPVPCRAARTKPETATYAGAVWQVLDYAMDSLAAAGHLQRRTDGTPPPEPVPRGDRDLAIGWPDPSRAHEKTESDEAWRAS